MMGAKIGHSVSTETRKKLSQIFEGKPLIERGHKDNCQCCVCKSRRGEIIHIPDDQKQKIGNGNKGKIVSLKTRKKISKARIGMEFTEEHRKKISKTLEGKTGPKSRNWKGGKSYDYKIARDSSKWKTWRELVFERDNYTCQECGDNSFKGRGKSIKLNAHHIKKYLLYPELRYNINNGITLCEKCHKELHRKNIRG